MGSWNQTCMLTSMPIKCYEDVASIFLVQRPPQMQFDHCYANSFYVPIPFILYGKYNDYGGVDDFCGPNQDVIVDYFKTHVIEMPQGENKYHEPPVVRKELTLEKLYDLDHDGRLFFEGEEEYGGRRAVDHIVIKKTLVDRILTETVSEQYMGDAGHKLITFDYLLQNIDDAVQYLRDKIEDEMTMWVTTLPPRGERKPNHYGLLRSMDLWGYGSRADISIPPQMQWMRERKWPDADDPFAYYFNEANFEVARELMIERIKFSWLEYFINMSRKTWYVPSGAGSQNQEDWPHLMIASYMQEEIKREREECDEEWAEFESNTGTEPEPVIS